MARFHTPTNIWWSNFWGKHYDILRTKIIQVEDCEVPDHTAAYRDEKKKKNRQTTSFFPVKYGPQLKIK